MILPAKYGARPLPGLQGIVSSMSTRLPTDAGASDYATVLEQTKRHQAWIPRFVAAVQSLGYTPEIDETYVPAGAHSTEYWFYAVRWPVPMPNGGTASCGIFVGDLYMNMDPLALARDITSNCRVDFNAGFSWAVNPVVTTPGATSPAGTSQAVVQATVAPTAVPATGPTPTQAAIASPIGEAALPDDSVSGGFDLGALLGNKWVLVGAAGLALFFMTRGK